MIRRGSQLVLGDRKGTLSATLGLKWRTTGKWVVIKRPGAARRNRAKVSQVLALGWRYEIPSRAPNESRPRPANRTGATPYCSVVKSLSELVTGLFRSYFLVTMRRYVAKLSRFLSTSLALLALSWILKQTESSSPEVEPTVTSLPPSP